MCHIELPTIGLKMFTSTKMNQILNQKLERPSITQIRNCKNYNSWKKNYVQIEYHWVFGPINSSRKVLQTHFKGMSTQ